MNLRKQVEPLKKAALQASSDRGMHTTRRRDSLRWNVGSNEPAAITRKAGNPNAEGILVETETPFKVLGFKVLGF